MPALTDQNGHGTGTGSVAVGRRWNSGLAADGFAPEAAVASYRITAGTGTLTTNAGLAPTSTSEYSARSRCAMGSGRSRSAEVILGS